MGHGGSVLPDCLCMPSVELVNGVDLDGRLCPRPVSRIKALRALSGACLPVATPVAVCVTESLRFPVILKLFTLLQIEVQL